MIKFKCSFCNKAIGVNSKYANRLIKCPACQNPTRVPDEAGGSAAQPAAAPTAQASPTTARAMEATAAHVTKPTNPVCPSCKSELFNPSDTMCGICGHLMPQPPLPNTPVTATPVGPPPVTATPVASTPNQQQVGLPVNPAIASPYAKPMTPVNQGYDSSAGKSPKEKVPSGRSIGAWFAAVGLGMFLAAVWGVIASFTGVGGQIFAWAIGAIVGLIAGLIARNPSIPFCLATTFGAMLCMLFGRLVSAWVIMMTVTAMTSFQDFGNFLIPETGVTIGVLEDMNNNGELQGEEKDLADAKIKAFFSNQSIYEMPEYDDYEYEVEIELDRKVRDVVKEMSDEDKQAMLDRVRETHPEWMEKAWHFEAVLDSMVANDEIEDEGLLAHAKAKLVTLGGTYDQDYYQDTTQRQQTKREQDLRQLVMDKYASLDSDQRAEIITTARQKHPSWTPVRHEYLAMLDAMYASDEIPKELKRVAKSTINQELDYAFDDEIEDMYSEKWQEQDKKLRTVVNTKLLELEQEEVDKLVDAAKGKYPEWEPDIDLDLLDGINDDLDETIARFESDGTFMSSLKTRFRTLDFVWLLLGMISAFAIAFTLGQSGSKS